MQEFDFLRNHGFGVVYGAEAVKQKIFELGSIEPNKGKNMNDNEIYEELALVDAPNVAPDFYIDAEGNRVELPFDVDSVYTGNGEATQPETAFIAEDGADHSVTV